MWNITMPALFSLTVCCWLFVELLEDMLYSCRYDISNNNVTALQLSYIYSRRLAFGVKLEITKEYTKAANYTECDFMLKYSKCY